jgi:hypothetical protein
VAAVVQDSQVWDARLAGRSQLVCCQPALIAGRWWVDAGAGCVLLEAGNAGKLHWLV